MLKKDEVSAALQAAYLDKDKMTIVFNPLVVNTGSKLVVIDTGNGPAAFEQTKGAVGQFHSNLAAAGIDAKAVDAVIISHFHGDHINGLLTADGKPAFPNAEVMVPAPEWTFWMDDGNMSKAAGEARSKGNFKNVRRVFGALGNKVTQYEPDKEIVARHHRARDATGTRRAILARISSGSGDERAGRRPTSPTSRRCSCAIRAGMRCSTWTGRMAEADASQALRPLAADRMVVQGFHYPFPAAGLCREGWRRLPAGADRLESGALTGSCGAIIPPRARGGLLSRNGDSAAGRSGCIPSVRERRYHYAILTGPPANGAARRSKGRKS